MKTPEQHSEQEIKSTIASLQAKLAIAERDLEAMKVVIQGDIEIAAMLKIKIRSVLSSETVNIKTYSELRDSIDARKDSISLRKTRLAGKQSEILRLNQQIEATEECLRLLLKQKEKTGKIIASSCWRWSPTT